MRIHISGRDVGYDIAGAGEQALVLLHAFPLNRMQWTHQLETLASETIGLRVLTPDLRGFGESSSPEAGHITVNEWATDVLALTDALGIESFILGGLSMGGYVAFALLRQAPHRVRALILADTRAGADDESGRRAREATAHFVEQRGVPALFDRDVSKLFSHLAQQERPDIIADARRIAACNTAKGVASAARGLGLRPDATDLLPQITCPTLIIVGEQDTLTPISDARFLFERVPNATIEIISDAGHLSNLEQPGQFERVIAHWTREHAP